MVALPPVLGGLRVAAPEDVLRIGIVATAGFRYSPLFRWERPYHEQHPADTLLSYRTQFQTAMESDNFIVLVQEDAYEPKEDDKTTAIIPPNNGWTPPEAGEKVVVGVLIVKLEPGSPRRGQLKDHKGSYPDLPNCPGRDLNRRHYDSWGSLVGSVRQEHCDGDSVVSMIVVHPAYWKRGYGTAMMKWARDLSEIDKVPQCVSAAPMSEGPFVSLGFQQICRITAEGDEDDPEGVSTALLEYRPKSLALAISPFDAVSSRRLPL
ncbi:GCN5-related N-acetyltransferase protein [Diplogelasinospora grovesii]|uniref:GCN5-related N-acetyltransferase protein n=1 Tax=Diplogelasinospora grovesii TaxID=303347 RepID=A0AAN6MYW7_9PEZI|nr:GCN5-related N-acetyltransferase protein [Diplogelasinospora grovesii]